MVRGVSFSDACICSCAILKYLCARYHLADHWYPDDIKCRARIDEFLFWSVAHLHPCTSSIYNHQVYDVVCRSVQTFDIVGGIYRMYRIGKGGPLPSKIQVS